MEICYLIIPILSFSFVCFQRHYIYVLIPNACTSTINHSVTKSIGVFILHVDLQFRRQISIIYLSATRFRDVLIC
jgi:hypothetical protein